MPRHIIFVCKANINRSPTAERMLKQMARESGYRIFGDPGCFKDYDLEISSAGTDSDKNMFYPDLGRSYEEIYAMDSGIADELEKYFEVPKEKIKILNIPDIYGEDGSDLIKILDEKLRHLIQKRK